MPGVRCGPDVHEEGVRTGVVQREREGGGSTEAVEVDDAARPLTARRSVGVAEVAVEVPVLIRDVDGAGAVHGD